MSATDRLDAIEARANAATRGPWGTYAAYGGRGVEVPSGDMVFIADGGITYAAHHPDAVFIADARTTVPALVAALRAALAIHEPIAAVNYGVRNPNITRVCAGCGQDDGNWSPWPCRTIRAIEGTLS